MLDGESCTRPGSRGVHGIHEPAVLLTDAAQQRPPSPPQLPYYYEVHAYAIIIREPHAFHPMAECVGMLSANIFCVYIYTPNPTYAARRACQAGWNYANFADTH